MKKSSRVLVIALIVLLIAGILALWQFTDVFGGKAPEAPDAAVTLAPAEEATDIPTEQPTDAPAEEASAPAAALADDTPLATMDGRPITLSEVRAMLNSLLDGGYLTDENDYEDALDYLIQSRVIEEKIKEFQLDQFTAEEEEAFLADAQKQWDDAISSYASYFLSEDTDEARAQARENAEAYFRSLGYSVEVLADEQKRSASYDLLEKKVLEGRDVSVSAEEIRQVFEDVAAQQKEKYENDVGGYEINKYYSGESFYTPDGYRGITHILLTVDEELLTAYRTAQAQFEESVTEEQPEGDSALRAARDEALQNILASKKAEIDDIYARLENGEDFEALIAQYGQDPGMQSEANLKEGYAVHPESILWDADFTSGAFSNKMQKPGDTSDPIVTSFGVHVLHYLRDIPGGNVELSDEISSTIEQYLASQKTSAVFSEVLDGWLKEHDVQYDQDMIAAAKAQPAESPAEE